MEEATLFAMIMDNQERIKAVENEVLKQDWKDHVTKSLDFLMGKYTKFEGEFDLLSHRVTTLSDQMTTMSGRLDRMDDDIQMLKTNTVSIAATVAAILVNLEKINTKLEIV